MQFPDKSENRPPKKEIKPVVVGAVLSPRPATRRFFGFLLAESPRELGAKIARDIIVPRIKAGFEESANSFLSGMLWGSSGSRPVSTMLQGTILRGGGTNYNAISSQPSALSQAMAANQSRSSSGPYQDVVCPTQERAEMLLAGMFDLLNEYRVVTVADLYELANMTPQTTHDSYGWYSLEGSKITHERDGYRVALPMPKLI